MYGRKTMIFSDAFVEMSDGVRLYTEIYLSDEAPAGPVVFLRNPYCPADSSTDDGTGAFSSAFVKRGYAVVCQHCRGTGRSEGDFIPFIHERRDGLETLAWIRKQPFYGGEIYPCGGRYMSAVDRS